MKTEPNDDAFPWTRNNSAFASGLTKRELTAIKIMAGLASSEQWGSNFDMNPKYLKAVAEVAVVATDALIAELSKEGEKQI